VSISVSSAIRTLAKFAISAGLLVFLAHSFNTTSILGALSQAGIAPMVGVVGILFSLISLLAFRWYAILAALGVAISYKRAFGIVLMGMFFNQLLPSAVGGDAYRIWSLSRNGQSIGHVVNSVLFDRGMALLATLVVISVGVVRLDQMMPIGPDLLPLTSILALVLVVMLVGSLFLIAALRVSGRRWSERIVPLRYLRDCVRDLALLVQRPGVCTSVLGVSVFINVVTSISIWLIAVALGKSPELMGFVFIVPAVMLLAMIPISIAGWGVREGGMVVALGFLGIGPADALAISVLFGVSMFAIGLPGGVVWILSREPTTSAGSLARQK
jgi:uncharacterized protein (TIRG00374 family)